MPKIETKVEARIRGQLAKDAATVKKGKLLGGGTRTLQRVTDKMAA